MDIQEIMTRRELTMQAKAMYFYLLGVADGADKFMMKSPMEIRKDLNIGDCAYHSNLKLLQKCGYIKMIRTKEANGRYSSTVCCINSKGGIIDETAKED